MLRGWVVWVMAVWLPMAVQAQPVSIPFVAKPPLVDGLPNDPDWAKAPTFVLDHRLGDGQPSVATTVRLCFSDLHLFALFVCEEPQPEGMRRYVRTPDGEVWRDDCVELFLAPDPNDPATYYHLVINSLGVVRDEFWQDGTDDLHWNSETRVAGQVEPNRWIVEVAIPLQQLDRVPILSDTWRVNFARERWATEPPELLTWQPCQKAFHEPERFSAIALTGVTKLSVVQRLSFAIAQREAKTLRTQLRQWQLLFPAQPRTETGKRAVALLREWEQRLTQPRDTASLWQQVRLAKREQGRWQAMVAQAKLVERLQQPYAVFAVSPMTKLRPEQMPEGEPVKSVNLFAARGEGESVQVLIAALEQALTNVRVTVSPLAGPKGVSLMPEVRLVGYVPVQTPTPGGFGIAGRFPDPLLPLRPFDVPQGEHQAVWLTVWVPQEAPAGDYKGTIIVEPDNAKRITVPMQVRVFPVTLPTPSFLKTCVLIWDYKAREVYGAAWTPERNRRFYELCLRYRFTPPPPLPWDKVFVRQPDGKWTAIWDEFDQTVEDWMRKGSTAFSIWGLLTWGTQPPPEEQRTEVAAKLRLLNEHLTAKGWSERFYFYVFDEPSNKEWDNIKQLCEFVRKHGPNLQVLLTAGYGATGNYRTHAPTPEGAAYRDLANYIKIWVPHIDCFDEPFLRTRKAAGDQVWMYVCISTIGKTYPDIWRIDWTGVSHRAIGWWLWRYECDGFLYWCVNYWTDDKGKPFDLFANPIAYPGGNGDGFLFYPDPAKGDPIPSVRAELFRDAIEDYDLLTMLKQKEPKSPLLRADDIILAPNKFVDDPRVYEQRHRALLEALAKAMRH